MLRERIHISGSVRNIVRGGFGVPGWLLRFARLMLVPKAELAAKLLAAEGQLAPRVSLGRRAPTKGTSGVHVRYRPRRGAATAPVPPNNPG